MIPTVLGIDISKDTFDVFLISKTKRIHHKFSNNLAGFKQLSTWLQKQQVKNLHACMEATGKYGEALAEYLYQQGYIVSVVNPATIKSFAQMKMRRNKTDKADAELIAEYCLSQHPVLWTPPPAYFTDLQALARRLDDLQAIRLQEANRLAAGVQLPVVVANLNAHLNYLDAEILLIKQAIQDHIDANEELKLRQDLLVSIPGIGKLTAARVLGEVRDVCDFDSARQLSAYAGATPQNFVSGTSVYKKARLSKTGNVNLRNALYMSSISAKHHNPIVRAFCDRLALSGLRPKQLICAAMHKLLHLIFGILKSKKPFDPLYLIKQVSAS